MNLKTEIRNKTALGFIAMFLMLALVRNPFIPDVCASMGSNNP